MRKIAWNFSQNNKIITQYIFNALDQLNLRVKMDFIISLTINTFTNKNQTV